MARQSRPRTQRQRRDLVDAPMTIEDEREATTNGGETDKRSPEEIEDEALLKTLKEEFQEDYDFESDYLTKAVQDKKFFLADSDNHWDWDTAVYNARTQDTNKKPTLSLNVTQQNVFNITNEQRMNMPGIKIVPTSGESSFKSAQVYESVVRNIEYSGNARTHYMSAHMAQVVCGMGYIRLTSGYTEDDPDPESENAFDQSIKFLPVKSHQSVLLDCNIREPDGSDAKRGWVFEDMPWGEAKKKWPKLKELGGSNTMDMTDDWTKKDHVRVCEAYRIVEEPDELINYTGDDGQNVTFRKSDAPRGIFKLMNEQGGDYQTRPTTRRRLQWYKIVGNMIVERRLKMPGSGRYIPIVRVVGREAIVNGQLERKGIIRTLKDTQRKLNYDVSSWVEFMYTQPKSPIFVPKQAVQGNETMWNTHNTKAWPYLPYNHVDEQGNAIPAPSRQQGPTDAPIYQNSIQFSLGIMSKISGQNDATMGNVSNERSGLAVRERRFGGDVANYDFRDNLETAIQLCGRIIVDWFPDVYDTKRVVQMMGRDGTQTMVQIDPEIEGALIEQQEEQANVERVLFNPTVGRYEVQSQSGPSYATQRQESWEAFTTILGRSPELMNVFGDLAFREADFPMADKIAERIMRFIEGTTPWLVDKKAPTPDEQQKQQAFEQLQQFAQQLGQENDSLKMQMRDKQGDLQIKGARLELDGQKYRGEFDVRSHEAISKRITSVSNAEELNDSQYRTLAEQTVAEAQRDTSDIEFDPVQFGAKQAPDGNFYLDDPERPGKYIKVGA